MSVNKPPNIKLPPTAMEIISQEETEAEEDCLCESSSSMAAELQPLSEGILSSP